MTLNLRYSNHTLFELIFFFFSFYNVSYCAVIYYIPVTLYTHIYMHVAIMYATWKEKFKDTANTVDVPTM